jgi:hypothetical protein
VPALLEPITTHADRDLFVLRLSPGGFRAVIPFNASLAIGAPFVIEAWGEAPELRGAVRGFIHDFKSYGCTSEADVVCDDIAGLLVHLRQAVEAQAAMARELKEIARLSEQQ